MLVIYDLYHQFQNVILVLLLLKERLANDVLKRNLEKSVRQHAFVQEMRGIHKITNYSYFSFRHSSM